MVRVSFLKPCEVAEFVKDGDTIVTEGFVASCCPESLTKALENVFRNWSSKKFNFDVFCSTRK